MLPRRLATLALVGVCLQGCYSYHTLDGGVAALPPEPKEKDEVRVTTLDGSQATLRAPMVVGDSLRGFPTDRNVDATPRAIPVQSIRTVEVRKLDQATTGVIVLAPTIALLVLILDASNDWADGFGEN